MKSIVTCAIGLISLGAFCGDAQTVRMTPCGGAQVSVVQAPPSYNAWPMVQTLGDKVVNFKRRRRKGYERKVGHRQKLLAVTVKSIA